MGNILVGIYKFLKEKKAIFWSLFIGLFAFATYLASNIHFEQDIYKMIPQSKSIGQMSEILKEQQSSNQIIVTLKNYEEDKEALIEKANLLVEDMEDEGREWIDSIRFSLFSLDETLLIQHIQKYLPVYLNHQDYKEINKSLDSSIIHEILESYQTVLLSPMGSFWANIIEQDPLAISTKALQKFKTLEVGAKFEQEEGYVFSENGKVLHFFIFPKHEETDLSHQKGFQKYLYQKIANFSKEHEINVEVFGAPLVATGNAIQMQKDTILTLSLTILALTLLFFYIFKAIRSTLYLLLPVVYGAVLGLAAVYLIQGSLSILALGAGAVILGVAVDFSVHFLSHYRYAESMEQHLKDIVGPLTLGAFTTIAAFFSLRFAQAPILRDLGTFAAFSLIGASLTTLLFLPQILHAFPIRNKVKEKKNLLDKLAKWKPEKYPILFWIIILATPIFYVLSKNVGFDGDLLKMNYMSKELQEAQDNINKASGWAMNSIFIVGEGESLDVALDEIAVVHEDLKNSSIYNKIDYILNPALLLPSKKQQENKISAWQEFWKTKNTEDIYKSIQENAEKIGYHPNAFSAWNYTIEKEFSTFNSEAIEFLKQLMPHLIVRKKNGDYLALVQLKVDASERLEVFNFLKNNDFNVIDRQGLNETLLDRIHEDFDYVLGVASILVFISLVIAYGRIELALITFIPLAITWVWILGIMTLLGISFNIVNVMIATLLFGLGDDYSIFMMDALREEYKYNKNKLQSSRTGVYLSVATTIIGLGTLIFAQHPALKSIALISIIGLICVLMVSQIVQPVLFNWFIKNRANSGKMPFTLWSFLKTLFAYLYFLIGCLVLIIIGFFLIGINPIAKRISKDIYHYLIHYYVRSLIKIMANVKSKIWNQENINWKQPGIIIANHSSFLDILFAITLYPKLIIMTNKWVWNSPFFGRIIRWADYYPIVNDPLADVGKLKEKISQGYHLVIFPEGTRSLDGNIGRFKKGAFYLAEKLNVPIYFLFIGGAQYGISKNDFLLKDAWIDIYYLNSSFSHEKSQLSYQEKTKRARQTFIAFNKKYLEELPTKYYKEQLIRMFIYKSPELEWYVRIKAKREQYYQIIDNHLPKKGLIYDLGAGYGLVSYMMAWNGPERKIVAMDYDEEKIELAKNQYVNNVKGLNNPIDWHVGDLENYTLDPCQGIILLDTLHYFPQEIQWEILNKCINALLPGGVLYYRDGMADHELHKNTIKTETWSIGKMQFNKTKYPISFLKKSELFTWAKKKDLNIKEIYQESTTSNTSFIISKNK